MKQKASAVWTGTLKEGKGILNTDSGAFSNLPYNFHNRFEGGKGATPEELIAAAHSGCFSMAFSLILQNAGLTPGKIETTATVTLEKVGEQMTVTTSHLDVTATVPGASEAAVLECAEKAKAGCPISRLLNAKITMSAKVA
ncbi:MAG TPA: OsmC family protein [Opitutaceae bacterium]|nr:OsmC family protein [Opitutaceae bacterium]